MTTVRRLMWIPMFAGFVLGLTATATAEEPAAVPAPARDYVDYLVDQLRFAKDDDDREDAAEELGKIGDPRAIPALEQAAIYDDEDDVRDESRKALKRIYKLHPAPVAVAPAPVVAPAPQPVVATPAPQPVVVTPAPVAVAPAPVVVAPAPVVVAPAYPVVVRRYYAPAPVVVAPAPVRSFGFSFGFAYRGHGGHHGHHGHH